MAIKINGVDKESTLHEQGNIIGVHHMADNKNLYEIQRSNNFEFYVDGLAGLVKDGFTDLDEDGKTDEKANDYIRLAVSSAFIPHFTQDAIEIKRGNSTIKYAGTPKLSSGKIEVYDYIGLQTKEILMAWQKASYDVKTEKVGIQSDYKKTAHLIEYSPDYQVVRTWNIYGCWISGISEQDYKSDSNGTNPISVTIEYDWAEIANS